MFDYQRLLAELPNDWHTLPIGDIGEVISGGTPSRDNPRYWGGEIPWVTPGEVTGFGRKHLEETDEKITAEGLAQSGAKLLPANSLLVTTRASLGAAVLNAAPASTNQGFKSIAFTKHFSPDYYYHWSTKLKDELVRLASGTTFLEIPGSHFRKIVVPAPPRAEQRLIARILDTLDIQIHKTEALIAKLEKVKEGLLHDLLTRGIDENGRLRPSPEQAPELYKESPLGLIPREWRMHTTGELSISIVPGRDKPTLSTSGLPWITISDLTEKVVKKSRHGLCVSLYEAKKPSLRSIPKNSVIMSCVGEFGISSVSGCEAVINQQLHCFIPNPGINEFWLMYSLRLKGEEIEKMATQTTIKYLNKAGCESIPLPTPTEVEQGRIMNAISRFDNRLLSEKTLLEKMRDKKTGLMDDLLTGRIRVMPLLDQAQATTPA